MYRVFNSAAPLYDWLTANDRWRDSIREIARHLPPSGATLRLIDVGAGPANSARALLSLRPDLRIAAIDVSPGMVRRARSTLRKAGNEHNIHILRADASHLPFPADSADAIIAHSVFYLLADQNAFLAEATRILRPGARLILLDPAHVPFPWKALRHGLTEPRSTLSILLWHAVGRTHARITPETMARLLDTAGFARVLGESAVNGYGVLSRGEKPNPAQVSALPDAPLADKPDELNPIPAATIDQRRGQYVFLLIRQTPNQSAWTLSPRTKVAWDAAATFDQQLNTPVALAFSSLTKAVAFMQPAVTSAVLIGVTRIAKFDKAIAARWSFPVLLNPDFEALRALDRFELPSAWLPIDPADAQLGDE